MNSTPNTPAIDGIYYGKRDAMIAEVSTQPFYEGRYLVQIIGDGQWDAEGFTSIREARKQAKYLAKTYGVRTSHVG